jgi:hypothetical protein
VPPSQVGSPGPTFTEWEGIPDTALRKLDVWTWKKLNPSAFIWVQAVAGVVMAASVRIVHKPFIVTEDLRNGWCVGACCYYRVRSVRMWVLQPLPLDYTLFYVASYYVARRLTCASSASVVLTRLHDKMDLVHAVT